MANQENTHIQAVPYLMSTHFCNFIETLLIKTITTLQINKQYKFLIFVEFLGLMLCILFIAILAIKIPFIL